MPEPVATSALTTAGALGAGPYLAVAFGLFVLAHYLLDQRSKAARDREHRDALTEAYAMVTDMNAKRIEETKRFTECLQVGVNDAVKEIHKTSDRSYSAIRDTNAQLIQGFSDAIRDLKPVLQKNTVAISRAELVMDGLTRPNGHA